MAQPRSCNNAYLYQSVLFVALVCILAIQPALAADDTDSPYTIILFIPASNSIPSTQIMDLINEYNSNGNILIATSSGLSRYNGTWSTRHVTHTNLSEGLLDDFVTSIEYDNKGDLWIGYSEGIQVYNGNSYTTLRDQQFFKSLRINDIQRWNNEMWIATGNAGLHRYRDGNWTWFQPFSPGGPGFYEATGMVWDHEANVTLISTAREGLWIIRSQDDPVTFECIAPKDSTYGLLDKLKRDYSGGVYFFNDTTVAHYSPEKGFAPVLTSSDLAITLPPINDLVSGPDGKLYLATDNGIYIWDNGEVFRHLTRFEGIGTNSVVRTINIDRMNRVWFSTPDNIGYYADQTGPDIPIEFELATTKEGTTEVISGTNNTTGASGEMAHTRPIPTLREDTEGPTGISTTGTFLDTIIQSLRSFFTGIGMKPRF